MKNKKKKGFTLTELIVVIVIIAILASVMIPTLTKYITRAKNSKDETLVASLNRNYENSKVMDNTKFYTAYDIKEFLKSIDMEEIEVANSNNLILFDTVEDKFILIDIESKELLESEYISHVSEFYRISEDYYGLEEIIYNDKELIAETVNGSNRAFIVSTTGNVISEVVDMFMNIEEVKNDSEYIKEMLDKVNDEKYNSLKNVIVESLGKTLFMNQDEAFYITLDYQYQYISDLDTFVNPTKQKLSRVVILPSVENVRLDVINELNNSVVVLPYTALSVTLPGVENVDNIEISGNTSIIENESGIVINIYQKVEDAYDIAKLKEIVNVNGNVTNEQELKDAMNSYLQITDESKMFSETETIAQAIDRLASSLGVNSSSILSKVSNIKILNSFSIKNDLEIYSGVTVNIPFGTTSNDKGNVDGTSTVALDFAHNNASQYMKCNLTVENGVTLTVNGNIIIAGVIGVKTQGLVGHTVGNYAQITLNGSMVLGSNANVEVYGYIMGTGNMVITNGAVLTQPFVIGDFGGGSNTAVLSQEVKRVPFAKYTLCNVMCDVKIEYGGIYQGKTKIWMSGKKLFGSEIGAAYYGKDNPMIIVGNEENIGLFNLIEEEAYVEINYDESKKIDSSTDLFEKSVGRSSLKIYGGAKTGSISLTLKLLYVMNITINTANYVLGLPYNMDFEFNSGEYFVESDFALLPGSEVKIANDATLTINEGNKLFVMPENAAGFNYSGAYYYATKDELSSSGFETEGNLINNGTIIIKGVFGGKITKGKNGNSDTSIVIEQTANVSNVSVTFGAVNGTEYSGIATYGGSELVTTFYKSLAVNLDGTTINLDKGTYKFNEIGNWTTIQ